MLIIIGVASYLITLIPMDPAIRQIVRVVAIVAVVLWLLGALSGHAPWPGAFLGWRR